jgi:hypothetical protein
MEFPEIPEWLKIAGLIAIAVGLEIVCTFAW